MGSPRYLKTYPGLPLPIFIDRRATFVIINLDKVMRYQHPEEEIVGTSV